MPSVMALGMGGAEIPPKILSASQFDPPPTHTHTIAFCEIKNGPTFCAIKKKLHFPRSGQNRQLFEGLAMPPEVVKTKDSLRLCHPSPLLKKKKKNAGAATACSLEKGSSSSTPDRFLV